MICNKCGAELKDNAAFCQNCGGTVEASVPETQPVNYFVNNYQQEKKHVSVGGWILRGLISYIPCVGSIIYLIMLFVWSGDDSYDDSARNWAKAQLILLAIALGLAVIGIIIMILFPAVFAGLIGALDSGSYYYY